MCINLLESLKEDDFQITGETEADYEFKWQRKDSGFGGSFFLLHCKQICEDSSSSSDSNATGCNEI